MQNNCIIDSSIILTIHREPRYVARLLDYIINSLGWNCTSLILEPKVVAEKSKVDRADVSRGMRRLKELNLIRKRNTVASDYFYMVNYDYIFKGDSRVLSNKFNKIESNESKVQETPSEC